MHTFTHTPVALHQAGGNPTGAKPGTAFAPSLRQGLCAAAVVLLPYAAMTGILLLNR